MYIFLNTYGFAISRPHAFRQLLLYIIQNSYHSLTTLMLADVLLPNALETLEFPSLSFLSLWFVQNLKHRMSVPALTTYHEGYMPKEESFPMPLPLLTEYGTHGSLDSPFLNPTRLHQCYPNISRASIRCPRYLVRAALHSLSSHPTSLPMLRILAVGVPRECSDFNREERDSMMDDVFVRNAATGVEMELCFDGKLRAPLYFASVRFALSTVEVN